MTDAIREWLSKVLNETVGPRRRVADNVYAIVKRAIIRHELVPGSKLSVPALAAELGVSRSPVREAVLRLIQEGLAAEEPHRGAVVASYNVEELVPLYEVRAALEGLAARLASERGTPESFESLSRSLEAEEDAIANDDMERHLQADIDFHEGVLSASGNPALQEMLGEIYSKIQVAMLARVVPTGPQRALDDHRAIFHAVQSGDPDEAETAARNHVERVHGRLVAQKDKSDSSADG